MPVPGRLLKQQKNMRDKDGNYIGPETGHHYLPCEKIDPVAEGIGYTGDKSSPSALVNGKEIFKRIFIRRKTPDRIWQDLDFSDPEKLRIGISVLVEWFIDMAQEDVILEFSVKPLNPTTEQQ